MNRELLAALDVLASHGLVAVSLAEYDSLRRSALATVLLGDVEARVRALIAEGIKAGASRLAEAPSSTPDELTRRRARGLADKIAKGGQR